MGVYAGIITSAISTGVKLLGSAGGPSYPSYPKIAKINIPQVQGQMEDYEKNRMQTSIDAWKAKFPLLYQGGASEIADIGNNQQGKWSPVVSNELKSSGLESLKDGTQYSDAVDVGLSPITLAQRNSQAVNRQIAMNPEWSSKISGGTLATMIANNYQNQQAFTQFLGAQNTANYVNSQKAGAYNTAALTTGLFGTAAAGEQAYVNAQNPLNAPFNPNSYNTPSNNYGAPPYGAPPTSTPPYGTPPYNATPPPVYGNSYGYGSFNMFGGSSTPSTPMIYPPATSQAPSGDPFDNYQI